MSEVTTWFERKFEISFPVELLPDLRARLRGTPARLEDVLRGRPHGTSSGSRQQSGRPRNTPVTCLTSNRCGCREWAITWR